MGESFGDELAKSSYICPLWYLPECAKIYSVNLWLSASSLVQLFPRCNIRAHGISYLAAGIALLNLHVFYTMHKEFVLINVITLLYDRHVSSELHL